MYLKINSEYGYLGNVLILLSTFCLFIAFGINDLNTFNLCLVKCDKHIKPLRYPSIFKTRVFLS